MDSWQSRVVDVLCRYRHSGYTFEQAWAEALLKHPPRGRDAGAPVPRLFDDSGSSETANEFFRRVARNAWHDEVGAKGSGNGPALRHFRVDLLRSLDDETPVYVKRTAA